MPHAELKYSADLVFDAAKMMRAIETTTNQHDPSAGECKGRAYPAITFAVGTYITTRFTPETWA